jgi:hypothetical protein
MFRFDARRARSVAQSLGPRFHISYRHSQAAAVELRSCAISETVVLEIS